MTGPFLLKRDNLQLGILLGIVMPILVFLLIYLIRFTDEPLGDFISSFSSRKDRITFFGVWFIVGNIALFTYYVNTHKDRTAKGIFAMTLLYGIGVLVAKVLV